MDRRRMLLGNSQRIGMVVNGEIKDSWETIVKTIQKGQAQKYYSLGDWKTLDMGSEGQIRMELVGFDVDNRSDGTGKAPTTWIGLDLLKSQIEWGSQAYVHSTLRNHYHNIVKSLVPEPIRSNLVMVKKTNHNAPSYPNDSDVSNEEVWAPALDEVCLSVPSQTDYANHWNGSAHNKKTRYGTNVPSSWWLRDSYSNQEAESVQSNGTYKSVSSSEKLGVPLCFCL